MPIAVIFAVMRCFAIAFRRAARHRRMKCALSAVGASRRLPRPASPAAGGSYRYTDGAREPAFPPAAGVAHLREIKSPRAILLVTSICGRHLSSRRYSVTIARHTIDRQSGGRGDDIVGEAADAVGAARPIAAAMRRLLTVAGLPSYVMACEHWRYHVGSNYNEAAKCLSRMCLMGSTGGGVRLKWRWPPGGFR